MRRISQILMWVWSAVILTVPLTACAKPTPPSSPPPPPAETPLAPTSAPTRLAPPTPTGAPDPGLGVEPDQLNGVTVAFWHGFSGARAEVLAGWGEAILPP